MSAVSLRKANAGEELRDFRGSVVTTGDTDHVLTTEDGTEVVLSEDAVKAIRDADVKDAPSHTDGLPTAATSGAGSTPGNSAAKKGN